MGGKKVLLPLLPLIAAAGAVVWQGQWALLIPVLLLLFAAVAIGWQHTRPVCPECGHRGGDETGRCELSDDPWSECFCTDDYHQGAKHRATA